MDTKHRNGRSHSRWFEELTLPMALKETLTREADEAWERQRQKESLEDAAAYAAAEVTRQLALAPKPEVPLSISSPKLKGRGSRITLIEPALILRLHNRMTAVGLADKQRKENLVKTVQHVAARGPQRIVHRRRDWQPALNSLRTAHANFAPVLELIERELTLAGPRRPVVLPPLLLNGPPGCGKTFFAQHLAAFFGTGFERISMETAQTAADLTGTAAHWGNTQPGRLFNRLIESDHANPVFLLDEVDKAGGYESHRSDKALYALLERESAKHWADASLPDLVLDASHVIWLLTSNDARLIPAPLRSRMTQFDIQPLGPHEARQLVRLLYRRSRTLPAPGPESGTGDRTLRCPACSLAARDHALCP